MKKENQVFNKQDNPSQKLFIAADVLNGIGIHNIGNLWIYLDLF